MKLSLPTFAKLKLQLKLIISPTVSNFVIEVEKNQIYTRQFYNAKMIPGIRKELKFHSRYQPIEWDFEMTINYYNIEIASNIVICLNLKASQHARLTQYLKGTLMVFETYLSNHLWTFPKTCFSTKANQTRKVINIVRRLLNSFSHFK